MTTYDVDDAYAFGWLDGFLLSFTTPTPPKLEPLLWFALGLFVGWLWL